MLLGLYNLNVMIHANAVSGVHEKNMKNFQSLEAFHFLSSSSLFFPPLHWTVEQTHTIAIMLIMKTLSSVLIHH